MSRSTFLFIDALSLIHRAYHAYPHFKTSSGQPTGAIYGASRILTSVLADIKPQYIIVAFDTPQPTFRHKEYKQYKAKRPKPDQEMIDQIGPIKDFFNLIGAMILIKDGFEADDLIGSGLEELSQKSNNPLFIILSGDYDLAQLIRGENIIFRYTRGSLKGTESIKEADFLAKWGFEPASLVDYKALAGDASDNIPGARGIGKKTGQKLISRFKTVESIYQLVDKKPDQISQTTSTRVLRFLQESRDMVFFSKRLATIKTDLKLNELARIKKASVNQKKLADFFKKYNFKSLKPILANKKENNNQNDKGRQLSLV